MKVLLRDGLRVQARVGDPDRCRRGDQVRDLDVLWLELSLRTLAVDRERADQPAFEK